MATGGTFYRVSDRGHGIAAVNLSTTAPPPPRRPRAARPQVRTVHPSVLAVALDLAGGDHTRLRFDADGSVTIANTPRT